MRKTFQLHVEGKNRDRVLDAVKHEIRKYIKRERRRDLPEGADFWDFDCRFGRTKEDAQEAHLSALTGLINAVAACVVMQEPNQLLLEARRPNRENRLAHAQAVIRGLQYRPSRLQ